HRLFSPPLVEARVSERARRARTHPTPAAERTATCSRFGRRRRWSAARAGPCPCRLAGLQLVHDLTEQLHGTLAVTRDNRGTTFTITFNEAGIGESEA